MKLFFALLLSCVAGCCSVDETVSADEPVRERVATIVRAFIDAGPDRKIFISTDELLQIWPECATALAREVAERPYKRGSVTTEEYDRLLRTDPPAEVLVRTLVLNVLAEARPEDVGANPELRGLLRAVALDDVWAMLRVQAMSILARCPVSSDLEVLVRGLHDGTSLLHGGIVAEVAQHYLGRLLEGVQGVPAPCELTTQKERDAAMGRWLTWWHNHKDALTFDPETERFRHQ